MRAATTRSHPLYEELRNRRDERINQRLVTVRSWVVDSRELVELFSPLETILAIPWLVAEIRMPELRRTGSREWRERAEAINIAEVEEMLEEVKPNIIIATDGSIREGVTAWGNSLGWHGMEG